MGACGSSPQLGESQDLEEPDLDRQFTRAEDSDDASPPDPTAKRARAAANRFVQFTETLPSMAGKVVVVTGATGGPLLVAATLAERGAYVVIMAASPLRPEHRHMVESSMAEAVATFEQADDIPEESEGDLSRAMPEEGSSTSFSREHSHRRSNTTGTGGSPEWSDRSSSRRRQQQPQCRNGNSNGGGKNSSTSNSGGGKNSSTSNSGGGKNSRRHRRSGNGNSVGPIGESDSSSGRVPRNVPVRLGAEADLNGGHVPRNARMARTARAAQTAHRASSMTKGGARERLSPAQKRGYVIVACDFQDLPSVCDAAYGVLSILEKELKCGLDIIINMAEERPRNERSRKYSKDGFDCQIQGNLLSHYLLTQLLMPALTAGAELSGNGRIVNCTSGGLRMLRSDIDNDAFEQVVVLEGNQGQYRLHDMRLKQSQKAVAVFTLGLRDVMQYANINIVPSTAHHGLHECIFSTESPREHHPEESGLTRNSAMDTFLPVLACVCRDDIEPGDFFISGPDVESQMEWGSQESMPHVAGVGDPESVDLGSLPGVNVTDGTIQMVWELCHQAVSNYMP